ncbi:reverse transcriptase domain-containing protein [Tanacetum coccineum]|uniref:Reverse transcriptase domain-containing protein n=1 Tax=Tanacetum coccineum TaxID=301880 RepID=A0ABQ5ISF1_9ASTR
MLKRLCGNEFYYFLDGFSGFFQIPIASEDQEKTTFTCPYGTFAYRQMSFGLYNAPATFQRCMTTIFHDMVEDFMEVFMDDLSVFGFDIEIKDKKGAENLAADHLSRLENPDLGTFTEEEINDKFPDEHLMILKAEINNDEPWYDDYVNYIVGKCHTLSVAETRECDYTIHRARYKIIHFTIYNNKTWVHMNLYTLRLDKIE